MQENECPRLDLFCQNIDDIFIWSPKAFRRSAHKDIEELIAAIYPNEANIL